MEVVLLPGAEKMGLLTTDKKGKSNISLGSILEIEGLSILKCEQALELSDASDERSAAICTITPKLLRSNG